MKRILVVAVHPDDETLGCGGTLLKQRSEGNELYWLILTSANQRITHIRNITSIQKEYIIAVAEQYAFKTWRQLNYLTTELDRYPLSEIITDISNYVREIQPDVLYFHHHGDIHSDHRVAFEAVMSCTKSFRFPFIKEILLFETLSETEFAPALQHKAFIPNVFIDVTPFMNKKVEIMKLFTTEQMDEPWPRAESSIKAQARYRGSRIGVEYAEAFSLLFAKY